MSAAQKAQTPLAGGASAETKTDTHSLGAAEKTSKPDAIDIAEFRLLRGRFAARGYALQRVLRSDDGRVSFHVLRGESARILGHASDLRAHLAQIEEAPHHGV